MKLHHPVVRAPWLGRRRRGPAVRLVAALALVLLSSPARGDLNRDVGQLVSVWAPQSRVRRLPPRLYERGPLRPLLLPSSSLVSPPRGCTSVAVLGSVSTTFALQYLPPAARRQTRPVGEAPVGSVAGAAQVVRCGIERPALERLAVEMRSSRGVLEVVVAQSAVAMPSLRAALPHRDPGPNAVVLDPAPVPRLAPIGARTRALVQRTLRQGDDPVGQTVLRAGPAGAGVTVLRVSEGCHRFDMLSMLAASEVPRPIDLDLDVLHLPSGEVAARDHGNAADATVAFCVGRSAKFALRFTGVRPRSPVLMLHAVAPLPEGLPRYWGPSARAHAAEAIRRHHRGSLGGSPVYQSFGVTGVTALPVELEPDACYVAAVGTVQGEPRGLSLSAEVGARTARNHGGQDGRGVSLAFCAESQQRALLTVEAQGNGVAWLLGLWQTARLGRLGTGRSGTGAQRGTRGSRPATPSLLRSGSAVN